MSILKLGINENISNEMYHSDKEFMSSSDFKLVLKDPAKFYDEKILGNRDNSPKSYFDEGSLTHSLILEPHLVASEYAFYTGARKQGKDWEEFAQQNPKKTCMTSPQKIRCDEYLKAYKKNKAAKSLITGGMSEFTLTAILQDLKVKTRTDYINVEKGYIVDVKTSGFAVDRDSFKQTMRNFGYELSAALYLDVAESHFEKEFDFYFIVIGKKDFTCEVFKLSQESRMKGKNALIQGIKKYKQCKETNVWTSTSKCPILKEVSEDILEV